MWVSIEGRASMTDQVRQELARRPNIWAALKARGGPDGVRPEVVKELRIHRGQQGIFRDLELTQSLKMLQREL
jgi:hypothetical protein